MEANNRIKAAKCYIDASVDNSPGYNDSSPGDIYDMAILQQAIDNDLTVYKFEEQKRFDVSVDFICEKIEALGGRKLTHIKSQDGSYIIQYIWPNSRVFVWLDDLKFLTNFYCTTTDLDLYTSLQEIIGPLAEKENNGTVSVLLPGTSGLYAKSIGVGGVPLERRNYNDIALAGYDSIVKDLSSSNPLGRLSIIDGPPGTGKTFIIRGLLNEAKRSRFLILPSNSAEDLSGPAIMKVLIDMSNGKPNSFYDAPDCEFTKPSGDSKGSPIVLIIEDADRCLSPRKADNASAISTILNLSDGIIGNLLDLRIICTTNAEIEQIDEALLRPGRLSARVEVGLLDKAKATEVFKRIGGTCAIDWNQSKFYSLAEVYAFAKGIPEVTSHPQNTKAKRTVGFSSDVSA